MSSQVTRPYVPGLASALRTADPAEAQEAFHRPRWLREEREAEARYLKFASAVPSAGITDRHETAEAELDRMIAAEDRSYYDLEGICR